MPMAAASTGTRKSDLRALSHSSSAMIAAPMAAPMAIIVHGSLPPNMPLATEDISVACCAARELGCSVVCAQMPYACSSRLCTGALIGDRQQDVLGKRASGQVEVGGRRVI